MSPLRRQTGEVLLVSIYQSSPLGSILPVDCLSHMAVCCFVPEKSPPRRLRLGLRVIIQKSALFFVARLCTSRPLRPVPRLANRTARKLHKKEMVFLFFPVLRAMILPGGWVMLEEACRTVGTMNQSPGSLGNGSQNLQLDRTRNLSCNSVTQWPVQTCTCLGETPLFHPRTQ